MNLYLGFCEKGKNIVINVCNHNSKKVNITGEAWTSLSEASVVMSLKLDGTGISMVFPLLSRGAEYHCSRNPWSGSL
jgi:hypothetical protein